MSARFGLRATQGFRQFTTRFQRPLRHNQKRYQSTADGAAAAEPESGFAKLWNSPVGPKTVHFWAPIMKWGLVLAGASDFTRPADQLSLSQNAALTATGAIWTRWCLIIKPRNVFLASVNFLVFCVGATQVARVLIYQRSLKNDSLANEVKTAAKDEGARAEKVIEDPHSVKEAVLAPK